MKSILSALFFVFTLLASAQNVEKITLESLLKEMVDRDAVARFPRDNFRLKQESSYNRASKTPNDTVGWFNNHDYNDNDNDHNFIRTEEKNGQKEWVLMDHVGPGALVRTWMPFLSADKPNTDIEIKIYLDGNTEPVLQGNMLGLLDGTGEIPFPFAHQSLRSAVSFFPIPYAKSCKITTTQRPFFYVFTYRSYDDYTPVKTFTKDDFNKTMPLTQKIGKLLLEPNSKVEGTQVAFTAKLGSKKEKSLELPEGNAVIRALSIKLKDYKNLEVTRSVVLKIEFDGEQTVWTPIGDFFGSGIGLNPHQGWHIAVSEDGTMTSRWPMPYQKSGKITVVNLGKKAVQVDLKATVGNWNWDSESMYFNAAWRGQYPVATRPYSDWNYVILKGRGVYVGDALTVMNPVARWWGEGDEKIWVDGEDFPSIFGTGTEDYYGYSWGGKSNDFYEHPFHAQPRSYVYNKVNIKTTEEKNASKKNTLGYSTELRTRSLDIMPFSKSLQLDMEVWSWTDCEMGYGVGVYWYGDKQTTSNRVPDEKEALNVPPLPTGFPKQ
ncbi:glycoside hydrolase family 172 protein [Formosa sp. PL04]|uniref:glycoside hydrolase family 172 protein n=1 Tax=Formosa sp. PL04 TaxID=3081755 RepID=UPI002982206F|nr:glycoside hydrolase family 172 protein [Formosa sp. PL04]MDW5290293.1 glycoside hydrolase family 172 protein [Formosa sp. PL04]